MLISLPNPNYQSLCMEYNHLPDITANNKGTKLLLPIHLVLRASEYAKRKDKDSTKDETTWGT